MSEDFDVEESAPWLVILITLIGGFLRLLLLGTKGLWLDETFSVWMAGHSIGDMLQWVVRIDQNPPLYYLLLHYWMAINGDTPYSVRLLSVLFGTGTIPIVYLIGKRISGAAVGLAAAALMAASLFNIYYAQEARMYTLLAFNTAVAIYALVRLLTDPRSVKPIGSQFREYLQAWRTPPGPAEPGSEGGFSYRASSRPQSGWGAWVSRHHWLPIQAIETDLAWVAFIIFSVLTLLSHNTAVFFLLAANIFVLGLMLFQRAKTSEDQPVFQAPPFWNWVKAQIGILLLWLPWIYFFIKQAGEVYQRFWIPAPTWDSVLQTLRSFLITPVPIQANIAAVIWSVYALVFCLGLVHFRKRMPQFLFLATLFAVPLLGELVVSIWRPIFGDRTLIWTTIPLLLVLAAGIAQLKFRFLIIMVLGAFCFSNVFAASDYFKFYQKEDWNSAARFIAGYTEKDDLILFNSNFVEIPFDYYFEPYETYYQLQVEERGVPQDLFESGILEPLMTTNDIPGLISLLQGHQRVWLVYSHDSYTDPQGLIPQTLASRMKLVETDEFNGGKVQLYVSP